eukprot:357516-Chlamydomonas_euryale.AAC.11
MSSTSLPCHATAPPAMSRHAYKHVHGTSHAVFLRSSPAGWVVLLWPTSRQHPNRAHEQGYVSAAPQGLAALPMRMPDQSAAR